VSNRASRLGRLDGKAVVAELAVERRRVAMAFRAVGAVRLDRAVSLESIGLRYDGTVDYLVRLGVIHDVDGGYWFDDARFQSAVEAPRFRTIGMVAVIALMLFAVLTVIGVITAG
jgi:hypothetical protein